jgi:hypothetical protein
VFWGHNSTTTITSFFGWVMVVFLFEISFDVFNETHERTITISEFDIIVITIDGMVSTRVTSLEYQFAWIVVSNSFFQYGF